MMVRDGSRGGESSHRFRRLTAEGRPHEIRDGWMAECFEIVAADGKLFGLQHLPSRGVDQLQPALRIDGNDTFDHSRKDGFGPRPISSQLIESATDAAHGGVNGAGRRPQLVVPVVD